jgi:hypothetical protein
MPIPSAPEFRDGSSEGGGIAVTGYQVGSRGSPPIVRSPGKHATVGTKIGRIHKKRFSEVGERRFSASKPPGRLRAENEAMRGRRRSNAAASIRVFERRVKILSGQRLRCQALERDM